MLEDEKKRGWGGVGSEGLAGKNEGGGRYFGNWCPHRKKQGIDFHTGAKEKKKEKLEGHCKSRQNHPQGQSPGQRGKEPWRSWKKR